MGDHVVASVDDLNDGERLLVELEGREIALFNLDGEYHALLNWCAHQGGPCGEGKISNTIVDADFDRDTLEVSLEWGKDDQILNCPWHAWEYDITSGECLSRDGVLLPSFPVSVESNEIVVSV
jgi:nitrite reductase/ring-hydroxylating ferredoxin subunit